MYVVYDYVCSINMGPLCLPVYSINTNWTLCLVDKNVRITDHRLSRWQKYGPEMRGGKMGLNCSVERSDKSTYVILYMRVFSYLSDMGTVVTNMTIQAIQN